MAGSRRATPGTYQCAGPEVAMLPSALLQPHRLHPLQLAPADGIRLMPGAVGPLASPRMCQQHRGQLTVHLSQPLRLHHVLHSLKDRQKRT